MLARQPLGCCGLHGGSCASALGVPSGEGKDRGGMSIRFSASITDHWRLLLGGVRAWGCRRRRGWHRRRLPSALHRPGDDAGRVRPGERPTHEHGHGAGGGAVGFCYGAGPMR